ncbi:MAG TPA: phosphoribosylanthranilate isomerase [Motiliproteus sp.]
MRTRVKICGITRLEDAQAAVAAGADAIGLVFYPPSPRHVSVEQASLIAAAIPAFVTVTALVVNPEPERLRLILAQVRPDLLQFHGDESDQFCASFERPYIKALRVRPGMDLEGAVAEYPRARSVLLDAYRPGVPGGTGEQFDWGLIPPALAHKIILAGGLECGNIARAVQQVNPYAVDVSGGVEASKGIKDHRLIRKFIDEVKRAD